MARSRRSFLRLQGTLGGITFVQSVAYGDHVRQPRGTHKEAPLNSVLQKNADATGLVNKTASPVLKALKRRFGGFAQTSLWTRMTGRLFKAPSLRPEDLLYSLRGMEVNERYPLARVLPAVPAIEERCRKSKLEVSVQTLSYCFFDRALRADSYFYEFIVLWLDGSSGRCESEAVETRWIALGDALPEYELFFEKPRWARQYLLLAGVQAGREQRPAESFTAMGAQVLKSGIC